MSRKIWLIRSLIGGAVLALVVRTAANKLTQTRSDLKRKTSLTAYDEVDRFIEIQMKRLNIPGAVLAIVEGNQIVHFHGFGKARPGGEAPSLRTPFFIGSLTKSITATAIMQLVEAGKIDLDAPVQRYLPWFRVADSGASARMTVRHLLNQTSGLPMLLGMAVLGNLDGNPDAAENQARSLSTLKLTRPVGSKFEYSNLNYNILGLIIEAASGETYEAYIEKHVFEPMDMIHSYTLKALAKTDGLAVGHRFWFGIPVPAPDLPVPRGSLSSGQLIASAEDMAHYLIAQLNGGRYLEAQLLTSAGIKEMQRGAAEINEMGMSLGAYGMGWIDQKIGSSRIISHSGIVPNFGGFMALVPEQKKGFVLLYNANHTMLKLTLDEVGLSAATRLAGETPAPLRLELPLVGYPRPAARSTPASLGCRSHIAKS